MRVGKQGLQLDLSEDGKSHPNERSEGLQTGFKQSQFCHVLVPLVSVSSSFCPSLSIHTEPGRQRAGRGPF